MQQLKEESAARAKTRRDENTIPPGSVHHDVLVLKSTRELYRAATTKSDGSYREGLQKVAVGDDGYRKVVRFARGSEDERGPYSEMGFSLLPIKPEPASAAFSCYLVNTPFFDAEVSEPVELVLHAPNSKSWHIDATEAEQLEQVDERSTGRDGLEIALWKEPERQDYFVDANRLDFVNPWTRADWSGVAAVETSFVLDDTDPNASQLLVRLRNGEIRRVSGLNTPKPNLSAPLTGLPLNADTHGRALLGTSGDEAFLNLAALPDTDGRFLLAMPSGSLLYLTIEGTGKVKCERWDPHARGPEHLKENPEVWRLLRNGCVIGRARIAPEDTEALVINLCSLRGKATLTEPKKKLAGTLDFKWRPGQRVRIAFQKPKEDFPWFEQAKLKVTELAQLWQASAGLVLEFVADVSKLDMFVPGGTPTYDGAMVDYDVLINLDPIGLTVDATRVTDPRREIGWPVSDVGAYALRRTYGIPTMFLGPVQVATGSVTAAYFDSARFRHLALHELGHALGLPHLHQSPDIANPFLTNVARICEILRDRLQITVTPAFVRDELFRRFEDASGNPYSEWPRADGKRCEESDAEAVARWSGDSVMMGLPAQAIYRDQQLLGQLDEREQLGPLDERWIAELYPRRP